MRDIRSFPIVCFLVASAALALPACGDSATGSNQGGAAGAGNSGGTSAGGSTATAGAAGAAASAGATATAGAAGSATTASGGSGPMMIADCQGHVYECGDLMDNDGDGLVDSDDPDCLGPCDNTEDSFFGGISGQPGPPCTVDCYFDQDSGAGNDDCHWSHQCDPHEEMPPGHPEPSMKCPYDPNANISGTGANCDELLMMQSQTCGTVCGPLTPNGCDCFGCCELPAGSGSFVWLGSEDGSGNGTCSLAVLDDPEKCQPCLPVPSCFNDCGKCELCIGKKPEDIPPECNPMGSGGAAGTGGGAAGTGGAGGSGSQCDQGIQPCGLPGQAACPAGFYCVTGCCQPIEIPK